MHFLRPMAPEVNGRDFALKLSSGEDRLMANPTLNIGLPDAMLKTEKTARVARF